MTLLFLTFAVAHLGAAAAAPSDVDAVARILRERPEAFTDLRGTPAKDFMGNRVWRGTITLFGMFCAVIELQQVPDNERFVYGCGQDPTRWDRARPVYGPQTPEAAWRLYHDVKIAVRTAAPNFVWKETVDTSGEFNTEAVLEGRPSANGRAVIAVYLSPRDVNGRINITIFQRMDAAERPAGAVTELTCRATSGSAQMRFALNLGARRIVGGEPALFFPANASITVTANEIRWPIGDGTAHLVLNRNTLALDETTALDFMPVIHLATCRILPRPQRQL
jgi:hypothetical protein